MESVTYEKPGLKLAPMGQTVPGKKTCERSERLNIWYRPGRLTISQIWIDCFPERLKITHKTVMAAMDALIERFADSERLTLVFMDNARLHHSALFQAQRERW